MKITSANLHPRTSSNLNWSTKSKQVNFLSNLGQKIGVNKLEDWYNVSTSDIALNGGSSLLASYNGSASRAIMGTFNDYEWLPWKFQYVPDGYWNEINNQKKFFDWLGTELKYNKREDWYGLKANMVIEHGGGGLLHRYHGSIVAALQAIFPSFPWVVWKFEKVPNNFWKDESNRRRFFDWLFKELKLHTMEDWYGVRVHQVQHHGGSRVLYYYRQSLYLALKSLYPQYPWKAYRFHLPQRYWQDPANVASFISDATEKFHITHLDEWYRISLDQIASMGAGAFRLVSTQKGLYRILSKLYPHHNWVMEKFKFARKKASQRWLLVQLSKLFPGRGNSPLSYHSHGAEIIEEYMHPTLVTTTNQNHSLQVDVYIPSLSLGFEYHGIQHYKDVFFFGPQYQFEQRDIEKRSLAKHIGVTLIEVPYWWDRQLSSLAATITSFRPDISSSCHWTADSIGIPIPSTPPPTASIADRMMHGGLWKDSMDPSGWLISEKLDGVRAFWNGLNFYSRQGLKVIVPDWFRKGLPNHALDGELWISRGRFQDLMGVVASQGNHPLWADVKYYVFDLPSQQNPFAQRYTQLRSAAFPSHVIPVRHENCTSRAHLAESLEAVSKAGGEGIVLRNPNAFYIKGRSYDDMLKLKVLGECEVKVLEVTSAGMMGSQLLCQQPNGEIILVQCQGDVLNSPPKEGSIITVQHSGFWNSKKLKYPFFLRQRRDMTWQQAIDSFNENYSEMAS